MTHESEGYTDDYDEDDDECFRIETPEEKAAALSEWDKRAGVGRETREEREQRQRLEKYRKKVDDNDQDVSVRHNMLAVFSAADWMTFAGAMRRSGPLFGDLWKVGDLAILFADTGVGKSILAVQIADALSRGVAIEPLEMPSEPLRVLYLDFELSQPQFAARYTSISPDGGELVDRYPFPDNFLRAEIEWQNEIPRRFRNFAEFMYASIDVSVEANRADVLIVDNITYLSPGTGNASQALALMQGLKHLKTDRGISILVLAHTPKRPFSQPLTLNDLQGSKMLSNFADSVFCLGASKLERGLRYIKHIKLRNGTIKHDEDNVLIYRIEKPENFLRLRFEHTGYERECIQYGDGQPARTREKLKAAAHQLKAEGRSERQIANQLGVSKSTIGRYLSSSPPCLGGVDGL